MLLILPDLQFDEGCDRFDDSAWEMIERKSVNSGGEAPRIVFWNLKGGADRYYTTSWFR